MSKKVKQEEGSTSSAWNIFESQIRYGCPTVNVPEQDDLEKFGAGKDILDQALDPKNGINLSSGLGYRLEAMKKLSYYFTSADERQILKGDRFFDNPYASEDGIDEIVDMFFELQQMTQR